MQVVILDYDGVIVDSLHQALDLWKHLHKKFGTPNVNSEKEVAELYETNIFEYLKHKGFSGKKLSEIIKEKGKFLQKHQSRLHPKITEKIKTLAQKYELYIVSSNHTKVIEQKLEALKPLIKEILGADKGTSKLKKIEHIKKENPGEEICFVTDTTGDIKELRLSRVKIIAATWGFHTKEQLKKAKPDKLVETPKELPEAVSELLS